jgi:hypothetical protein
MRKLNKFYFIPNPFQDVTRRKFKIEDVENVENK